MSEKNTRNSRQVYGANMKKQSGTGAGAGLRRLALIAVLAPAALCILSGVGNPARAGLGFVRLGQAQPPVPGVAQKEKTVAEHAVGPFDVKMEAQGEADKGDGSTLARYSLDKQYHGDLEGTAKGLALTAGTDVKGSAGYVALERVTGTLKGRSGSFVLQHSGTMAHGDSQLSITVVPDSGTGQLVGIVGKMSIIIAAGKHSYDFEYSLPAGH
jgi:Protein of unknown function (DUF3224)